MWILWAHDFNPTYNFIRVLSFSYSFVDVKVGVGYRITTVAGSLR